MRGFEFVPSRWLAATIALGLASPVIARAEAGVMEINQACATTTGCFAGDTAGFPVTIEEGGAHSFRLTSDLVVASSNTTAITIGTNDVSIDLGGFRIQGPNNCSGTPTTCSFQNHSGRGVAVDALTERTGVVVRNGVITGCGGNGVEVGENAVVRDLRLSENGGAGVLAGAGNLITDNTISRNGTDGVSLLLIGNAVIRNTVSQNGAYGIFAGIGSRVADNTVVANGGSGIFLGAGTSATGNAVRGNAGTGLVTTANTTYAGNVITANVVNTVSGGGRNLGTNHCNGTGTTTASCP